MSLTDKEFAKKGGRLAAALGLLISMPFIITIILICHGTVKHIEKHIKPICIYGKCIDKFVDKNSRNAKTVVIENGKGQFRLSEEWVNLYDYINIGDSIFKEKGSITLRIINSNIVKQEVLFNEKNSLYNDVFEFDRTVYACP
jgi:hypothetical protein